MLLPSCASFWRRRRGFLALIDAAAIDSQWRFVLFGRVDGAHAAWFLGIMELKVAGMSCQHCVKSVTEAVHSVVPGASVNIELAEGSVKIDGSADDNRPAIVQAIEDQGYEVAAQ